MFINWQDPDKVYLICGKTDLRKKIDGLVIVNAENYGLELYSNSLFFVDPAVIGLKHYFGMVKFLSCFINDLKMVD